MKLLKQLVADHNFSAYEGGVIVNSQGRVSVPPSGAVDTEQWMNLSIGFPPYLSVKDGVYAPEYGIFNVFKNGVILKMRKAPGALWSFSLRVTGLKTQTREFTRVTHTRFLTCELDDGVSCVLRTPAHGNTDYNPVAQLTINDVEFLIHLKTPVASVDMKASVCIEGEDIYLLVNGGKIDIPIPLTQSQSARAPFQRLQPQWDTPHQQQQTPPHADYVSAIFQHDF